MIVPLLLTAGVLGLLYTTRKEPAPQATPPATTPTPPVGTPGTNANGRPRPTTPSTPRMPISIRLDPDAPSGSLRAPDGGPIRVGDTIQIHGVSLRSDDNPEGYLFDFPVGGALAYQLVAPNEYRMIAPGRFTISWSPNTIIVVEVMP